jgi:atypical dual specificity phosphatase
LYEYKTNQEIFEISLLKKFTVIIKMTSLTELENIGEFIFPSEEINPPLLTDSGCFPGECVHEIQPRLFLGNEQMAKSYKYLKRLGITHVVNAAHPPSVSYRQPETLEFSTLTSGFVDTGKKYYKDLGIIYHGICIRDEMSFDISQHFHETASFIENALENENNKVLIHCFAGISRSPALLTSYLMIKQNMNVKDALTFITSRRPVRPNSGFLQQLLKLNTELGL